MKVEKSPIPDVLILSPRVFEDQRGFFMETYETRKFAECGVTESFVQDNHSGSKQSILRGLHYQIRQPQGKLVRVTAGEIFDVAVDIRRSSRTFGRWYGCRVSAQNRLQIWIPPGFAHGFYVISRWAEVIYKVTDFYAPQWERTIAWNDTDLGISWPTEYGQPLVSVKDRNGIPFREAELFD